MRPARHIAGYAKMRVSGAEPERLLSELARRGIPFWEPSPPIDYAMTVRVPARERGRVQAIAASVGCEAETVYLRGLPRLWEKLGKRWPIALLLFAAFLILAESQAYVWDIEIEGNDTIPDGIILQALDECGVTVGARWLDFSQDAIRNGVILRLPDIRWMTVTMQGCRARVIVREKRTHEPLTDEVTVTDIVAEKAGLVTEVRAKHGTALAEAGRAYLPGETLIAGYTTGRFGIQGATWAAGTVRARTWYDITAEAPLAVEEKTYTGEKTVRYALILGKNRINFYKGSSICTEDCDKIIERAEAAVEGWFNLPLAVEKITCRRYETRSVPAEELREELEELLMAELLNEIGEDGMINSSVFTASESGGVLRVTLRAECEEQIGAARALTDDEIAAIEARVSRNLY